MNTQPRNYHEALVALKAANTEIERLKKLLQDGGDAVYWMHELGYSLPEG